MISSPLLIILYWGSKSEWLQKEQIWLGTVKLGERGEGFLKRGGGFVKRMLHLIYKLYLKAVFLCVKFNGAIVFF